MARKKKINNHGEIEKVYVEGTHEAIITPEDFDTVQKMISNKSFMKNGKKSFGKFPAKNTWVKKTRCTCEHAMNRRVAHVAKNGNKSYVYQCYHQYVATL